GALPPMCPEPSASIPTVSLDVIALVASSCGYDRGHIEPHAAHSCTVHVAIQRGRAKRRQHRHPPRVQPLAPPARASLQTSTAAPEAWHHAGTLSRSRTSRGRTREQTRPQRLTMPRDALPTRPSSCRLLAMASPHWMLVGGAAGKAAHLVGCASPRR